MLQRPFPVFIQHACDAFERVCIQTLSILEPGLRSSQSEIVLFSNQRKINGSG